MGLCTRTGRFAQNGTGWETVKIKVVIHVVPAIPGCAAQGETFEELLKNLYDAVEGCLSVDV